MIVTINSNTSTEIYREITNKLKNSCKLYYKIIAKWSRNWNNRNNQNKVQKIKRLWLLKIWKINIRIWYKNIENRLLNWLIVRNLILLKLANCKDKYQKLRNKSRNWFNKIVYIGLKFKNNKNKYKYWVISLIMSVKIEHWELSHHLLH